MSVEVVIPSDWWEDDSEAVITTWYISDGASVHKGDLLAEIMVQKETYEIVAPADGTVAISEHAEAIVAKGATIARVT